MTIDWQTITVAVIVAAAALYVSRQVWQTFGRKQGSACGSCGNCPAGSKGGGQSVVEISPLQKPAARGQ